MYKGPSKEARWGVASKSTFKSEELERLTAEYPIEGEGDIRQMTVSVPWGQMMSTGVAAQKIDWSVVHDPSSWSTPDFRTAHDKAGADLTVAKMRIAELEMENAKLRVDFVALMAKAARPVPLKPIPEPCRTLSPDQAREVLGLLKEKASEPALPPDHLIESATEYYAWWGFPPRPISALPTTHAACRHCGAAFLAEVVSTHEASCELRPVEDEKVKL